MSELVIVGLLVLISIVFMVVEIFLLPGFSISGIVSVLFGGVAIWYAFAKIGVNAGLITLIVWLVMLGIGIWLFVRAKTLDKMSMNTVLNETSNLYEIDKIVVGMTGIATSRLAPMGKVTIDGKEYEAKSIDGFVDQKCEVEVTAIEDNKLIVKTL